MHGIGRGMLSVFLLLLILLCGCASTGQTASAATPDPEAAERSTVYVDSMDTFIELSAYGSNRDAALQAAKEEILRLNDILSIGLEDSEISRVNREGRERDRIVRHGGDDPGSADTL